MRLVALCLLLCMAGCATHREHVAAPVVVNPYRAQAEGLARSGVGALGVGRWQSAQRLFEKSLRSASLTGDEKLIALSWYNLGRAREAGGDTPGAHEAFANAVQHAEQAQDAVNRQRAALAMALLDADGLAPGKAGANDDKLLVVPESFPIDVHLAAAQLAVLRAQPVVAREAYGRVLQLAGQDRPGLIYAARAHLGLAALAMHAAPSDQVEARKHIDLALGMLGRAGDPRLLVKALRLAAANESDPARRSQWLQRADTVQRAWRESHPQ